MKTVRGKLVQIIQGVRNADTLTKVAVGVLVGSVIAAVIGHICQYGKFDLGLMFRDFYSNASTEAISIAITVLVIDQLNRRREERLEKASLKERLIRELGSISHDVAIHAAEELHAYGWLRDGSLQGAILWSADLQEANLANAKMQQASLSHADLRGVYLGFADLQGASLRYAKMQRAYLVCANLQGADLAEAHLQMANLGGANLQEAQVGPSGFDENTNLPDNTKWTPETDLSRFTDPNHPNFWRSDSPVSPAFGGKQADSGHEE